MAMLRLPTPRVSCATLLYELLLLPLLLLLLRCLLPLLGRLRHRLLGKKVDEHAEEGWLFRRRLLRHRLRLLRQN